ncbi:MAG: FtsQ-type POTRA domain-containing protein, partial [Terriglobales bacterium]
MARKSSSTAVQEELYPLPREVSSHQAHEREPFDDTRLVDLKAEQESPFLRGQKRISVRRGSLPKKTAHRLMWGAAALVILAILATAATGLYDYGKHSWRFRIDSSDQIELVGAEHVTHSQIMEVMGGDIGRNIFFVPLAQRQQQLEQIPWVESASVMRFVPNRLRIEIHERTPVAFVRIGSHISLIDAGGTLMELSPGSKHKYSFAVITGMNAGEPLSVRAARMKNYNALVRDLDSTGAHYSRELSEVDISDPEDVKVIAADANGEVLVHLGSGNYLQRYKTYETHVEQWRQQFDKLDSVDLRYDGQIIVNPDLEGMARQPALTPAAAKAAVAAGVKTAAIVNYEKYVTRPGAPAPAKKNVKLKAKPPAKAAAHRSPARASAAKPHPAKQSQVKHPPVQQHPVKQVSANPRALKARENPPVAVAKNNITPHPAVSSPSAPTAGGQKKPNPGIPKETT